MPQCSKRASNNNIKTQTKSGEDQTSSEAPILAPHFCPKILFFASPAFFNTLGSSAPESKPQKLGQIQCDSGELPPKIHRLFVVLFAQNLRFGSAFLQMGYFVLRNKIVMHHGTARLDSTCSSAQPFMHILSKYPGLLQNLRSERHFPKWDRISG
jgi:hypothetical protein